MNECRCGTSVPDDRRTCPSCGTEVNPGQSDPALQDQRRQGMIIAELRAEKRTLEEELKQTRTERDEIESEAAMLRSEIEELTTEYREIQDEIMVLKEMIRQLDARTRTMRSRFDAMRIPLFQPFVASQTPLFPAETKDAVVAKEDT